MSIEISQNLSLTIFNTYLRFSEKPRICVEISRNLTPFVTLIRGFTENREKIFIRRFFIDSSVANLFGAKSALLLVK